MENISKIIEELEDGPLSFTELKERTGLENGVLQHHIKKSEKIEKVRGAVMLKNECAKCKVSAPCENECIRKILNDGKKRQILELKVEGLTQKEIAGEIELSEATVSYHTNSMEEKGLIQQGRLNNKVIKKIQE